MDQYLEYVEQIRKQNKAQSDGANSDPYLDYVRKIRSGANEPTMATNSKQKNPVGDFFNGVEKVAGAVGKFAGDVGSTVWDATKLAVTNPGQALKETGQAMQSLDKGGEIGVHGMFQSANKLLEMPRDLVYDHVGNTGRAILDSIYGKPGASGSDVARNNAQRIREDYLKQPGVGRVDRAMLQLGETAVPILSAAAAPQSLAGYATRATRLLPSSVFFTSAAGQYADEAEQEGATPLQQAAYGSIMGTVEMLTEKLPFEKMMGAFGGKNGIKAMLAGMNAEGLQEAVTNPAQVLAKRLVYGGGKDEPFFDIRRELESYAAGAGTMGFLHGAGAGAHKLVEGTRFAVDATGNAMGKKQGPIAWQEISQGQPMNNQSAEAPVSQQVPQAQLIQPQILAEMPQVQPEPVANAPVEGIEQPQPMNIPVQMEPTPVQGVQEIPPELIPPEIMAESPQIQPEQMVDGESIQSQPITPEQAHFQGAAGLFNPVAQPANQIQSQVATPGETVTKAPESVDKVETSATEPTFKGIADFSKRVKAGEVAAKEVQDHYKFMLDNEETIKQSILDRINSDERYKRKRKDTKTKMVDDTFDRELERLAYAGNDALSYEVMSGDYKTSRRNGIKKAIDSLTDEAIQKHRQANQKYRESIEKSLTNPETLEEYRRFVSVKGEAALSPEQRVQYDELIAGAMKDQKSREQQRQSTVKQVTTNVGMELVETKHTKTGQQLFVVKMAERVDPDTYKDLNSKAKQLGGHYSSFRGAGAVPGFQFKTREAAERFMALREGDVSKADIVAERKEESKNRTAQKLSEMADRMTESADEELNRDRKTNTAKRANEAAHAENRARKEKAQAETIRNLAAAIESGEAKHLDGVTARTHVELLDQLLYDARNKAVRENDEEELRREPKEADINSIEYPYPRNIHKNILGYFVEDLKKAGAKMYAARLNKKLTGANGDTVDFTSDSDLEFLKKVLGKAKELRIDVPWYLESTVSDYNRLQTMGIQTLPQLRAALREYLKYRGDKPKADPVKAMERELIGTKIEGYFPTPKPVVDRMIEEAGIMPGMKVLEPSAVKGNIADAVREAGVELDVIEIVPALRNVLEAKKHRIVGNDFTEFKGEYDRIVMNPPFENGQDIDHVKHAYDLLKPGGRVVAIMSEGPFYRSDKKASGFREWLDEVGGTSEKLPEGSFKDSERSTAVNTRLVVIDKAEATDGLKLQQQMQAIREELIEEEIQHLKNEIQGVELVPTQDNPERKIRVSKNPKWYREFYKAHQRRPNKSELREMAIDRLAHGYTSDEAGPVPANEDFMEANRILGELQSLGKHASGYADTGGYSDLGPEYDPESKGKTKQKQPEVNVSAIEMPELIELAQEINDGKLPILREKLKKALGRFSFREDAGKILLRRDIFLGERLAELQLNPRKNIQTQIDAFRKQVYEKYGETEIVFRREKGAVYAYHRNPNLAAKVLAHEIGHMVDWLPEKSMSRGNLLGRIASLKRYTQQLLPERPGAPGALTESDRRRLRYQVNKLVSEEKKQQPEAEGPKPEEVLAIWNDIQAREKNPDLYNYVIRLEAREKSQILKEALKGMVNLPRFKPSDYRDWSARQKEIYHDLLQQEIKKRRLFELETIKAELKGLTQVWKPFDEKADPKYTHYRYSGPELYADALSVLVNNPSLLKQKAPNFYRAFFNFLEQKPQVKAVYEEIQKRVGDSADKLNHRMDQTYRNFTEGHIQRNALNQRRRIEVKTVIDTLLAGLVDQHQATLKWVRRYEEGKDNLAQLAQRARWELEETSYISAEADQYVHELGNQVLTPLKEAGLTVDDLGVYLFHQRVIHERADLANPEGYGAKTSSDMLAALRDRLGDEAFAKVEVCAQAYRKLREDLIIHRVEDSRMFSQATVKMMRERKHYARFSVQHYLEKSYGTGTTARIMKQVGTLNKIENPLVVTVLNDLSMLRAAKINEAKLAVVSFLREVGNVKTIRPADTRFNPATKKQEAAESKDPALALLDVMVDGEVHSFYVAKEIAESFATKPFEATRIAELWGKIMQPLKAALVSKNPIWMVRNIIRDLRTTHKNIPELKGKRLWKFLSYYGQAFKEVRKAAFKGERTADLRAMYQNFMLNPNRQYDTRERNFENDLERLAEEFHLEIYDEPGIQGRLKAFLRWLDKWGQVSEQSSKLAGYKFMTNETKRTPAEIAHIVRTRIGTPDVRRVGKWQQVTNSLFLFSNVNKEGWRAMAESYQDEPGAYIWKTIGHNFLPKLILAGLAAGIMRGFGDDDDKWKRMVEAIPDYDKRSYNVIPLGMTPDDRAVYLRLPEDYEGQIFGSLAYTLFQGKLLGKDGLLAQAGEQSPYDLDNPNPYYGVAHDLIQYWLYHQNPVDEYRGRNVLPQKVFEAGDWDANKRMLGYAWQGLGGSAIYTPATDLNENAVQQLLKLPGLNIAGAFVKISDRGTLEAYYEGKDKEAQTKARKSLEIENRVKSDVKGLDHVPTMADVRRVYRDLKADGALAKDTTFNEFRKQQYYRYAGKVVNDSRLALIMKAPGIQERRELIRKAQRELSAERYQELRSKLRKLGIH